jgi:hypothetical protein
MPQEPPQHTVDREPTDDTYRLWCKQAGAEQLIVHNMTHCATRAATPVQATVSTFVQHVWSMFVRYVFITSSNEVC